MNAINFDANASLGLSNIVEDELLTTKDLGLNPSSIHRGGQRARSLIEVAREEIRKILRIGGEHSIVFTSGATEANNQAIQSVVFGKKGTGSFVTTLIEHPSVIEPLAAMSLDGIKVVYLSLNSKGGLTASEVIDKLSPDVTFLSVMLANNETGAILPVGDIFRTARLKFPNITLHCDAVQGLGKIDFSFDELGADLVTISGHKIGALPGIGALVVKRGYHLNPLIFGGPQEKRYRAGTENVVGAVSFGIACRHLRESLHSRISNMVEMRSVVRQKLGNAFSDIVFISGDDSFLPNTISVRVPGVLADDLVVALDLEGVYISSGAACASGKPDPSHVLLALGMSKASARETIRISLCPYYAQGEFEKGIETVIRVIKRIRN